MLNSGTKAWQAKPCTWYQSSENEPNVALDINCLAWDHMGPSESTTKEDTKGPQQSTLCGHCPLILAVGSSACRMYLLCSSNSLSPWALPLYFFSLFFSFPYFCPEISDNFSHPLIVLLNSLTETNKDLENCWSLPYPITGSQSQSRIINLKMCDTQIKWKSTSIRKAKKDLQGQKSTKQGRSS